MLTYVLLALVSAVAMASSGIIARFSGLSAAELTFYRLAVGALCLLVFVACTGRLKTLKGKPDWRMAVNGVLLVGFMLTFLSAIEYISLANAIMLVYLAPPLSAFVAHWLLDERLDLPDSSLIALSFFGFAMLQQVGAALRSGLFVFTSNVDGQFQKAGFDAQALVEVHGSIHHLQCQRGCHGEIWPADGFEPKVAEDDCRLLNEPPHCRHCGEIARPNILMFDDWNWLGSRTASQESRFDDWLRVQHRPPLTVEIGAGTNVITVRSFAEVIGGALIRINPEPESALPAGALHLRCGALEGIAAIHRALAAAGFFNLAPPAA